MHFDPLLASKVLHLSNNNEKNTYTHTHTNIDDDDNKSTTYLSGFRLKKFFKKDSKKSNSVGSPKKADG